MMVNSLAQLGRIAQVHPREVWPHEAHQFTPWLLRNVDVLSELLGMDLILEAAEHPVGDFSLDLKGYDEATGDTVIVENQLEFSDHTHLGQILTYAAGTDPTTIIWLTTGFRSEHRAAIDWLNERTDEKTRFFGVVIKVVRIGDSEPAPSFELVAQPNDWEKQVRRATSALSETSGKAAIYSEFWELVLERIRSQHPTWTRARRSTQSWVNTSIGARGVVLSMAFTRAGLITQFYFEDQDASMNTRRFEGALAQRDVFEAALGQPVEWDGMEGRKAARIVHGPVDYRVIDTARWPEMVDWLIESQTRMRQALDVVGGTRIFEGT
jgi:hypothetical protein